MKTNLSQADFASLGKSVNQVNGQQTEQLLGHIMPAIENIEISLSNKLEDLANDTALGFTEIHGKVEFLRSEIQEIKQILNSLFR